MNKKWKIQFLSGALAMILAMPTLSVPVYANETEEFMEVMADAETTTILETENVEETELAIETKESFAETEILESDEQTEESVEEILMEEISETETIAEAEELKKISGFEALNEGQSKFIIHNPFIYSV